MVWRPSTALTLPPIYARAGIEEVWVVDVDRDEITRYGLPINAAYTVSTLYRRGTVITSVTLPNLQLSVDNILPY